MFGANESRVGAFFVVLAFVLVLALTMMAFTALAPHAQLAGGQGFTIAAN